MQHTFCDRLSHSAINWAISNFHAGHVTRSFATFRRQPLHSLRTPHVMGAGMLVESDFVTFPVAARTFRYCVNQTCSGTFPSGLIPVVVVVTQQLGGESKHIPDWIQGPSYLRCPINHRIAGEESRWGYKILPTCVSACAIWLSFLACLFLRLSRFLSFSLSLSLSLSFLSISPPLSLSPPFFIFCSVNNCLKLVNRLSRRHSCC